MTPTDKHLAQITSLHTARSENKKLANSGKLWQIVARAHSRTGEQAILYKTENKTGEKGLQVGTKLRDLQEGEHIMDKSREKI
jgi:hypothetical protein